MIYENIFSTSDVTQLIDVIAKITDDVSNAKEQCLKQILVYLLGREPKESDYKKLMLVKHPTILGQPITESVFWLTSTIRLLIGTISLRVDGQTLSFVFDPHEPQVSMSMNPDCKTSFTMVENFKSDEPFTS